MIPSTQEIQNLSVWGEAVMALPQLNRLFKGTKLFVLEQHKSRYWTVIHHAEAEAPLVVVKIVQMQG